MKIKFSYDYLSFLFDYPVRVLSSAFFNGGYGRRRALLNLKTNIKELETRIPEKIVKDKIESIGLPDDTAAMLTSANLKFAQFVYKEENGIKLGISVSAGTSNALNISERSETTYNGNPLSEAGTINIIIVTNMWLLSDCFVSTIISATEAKTSALIDLNIKSTVGKKQATGTGTDSITVVSGFKEKIEFAGGHTIFGQIIGECVYKAVKKSLQKKETDQLIISTIEKEMGY